MTPQAKLSSAKHLPLGRSEARIITKGVSDVILDTIALILVIIGALNWGLIGLLQFDFVAFLFGGQGAALSRIVYGLIGIAGAWSISLLFRDREAKEAR